MESYFLTSLIIKLLLIGLGCLLVIRGKKLKAKNMDSQSFVSPSAMILIGFLIVILNTLQILWSIYGLL